MPNDAGSSPPNSVEDTPKPPLKAWGRQGRPPKSAAGTYVPQAVRTEAMRAANPDKPRGKVASGSRGGAFAKTKERPDIRAAARALYEATPGASCVSVAKETGIPEGTVRRWKSEEDWRPAIKTMPDLAGRAGNLANTFKMRMTELGKPLDDAVAAVEVAKEVSEQHAVDIRAGILDRHRREWAAPRKIIYDAIQQSQRGDVVGAYDKAKLGKIAAETLQIVQVGECRAFGLNEASRSADGGTVVVVERDAPLIEGEVAAPGTVSGGEVEF